MESSQMNNLKHLNIAYVVLPGHLAHLATSFNAPVIILADGEPIKPEQQTQTNEHLYTLDNILQMTEDAENGRLSSMSSIDTQTDTDSDTSKVIILDDIPTNSITVNNTSKVINLDDIKTNLATKYKNPLTVKEYANGIKRILGDHPDFDQFEDNYTDIIADFIQDNNTQPSFIYRHLTILLKTYELLENPDKIIIEYLTKMLKEFSKIAKEEKVLQPPTAKEQANYIPKEKLQTIRDTLYDKVLNSSYNKDAIAFLISSIYLHCPPIRPGEISNTTTTKTSIKTMNFLDLTNLKWHINQRKNKDTHILDIPQALADDINLIKSKHNSIHLIPQLRKSNAEYPMDARQILREVQVIYEAQFNIPNFTFQINRKSAISDNTPHLSTLEKKQYAKECRHSLQTQQLIYNTFNQS